MADKSGGLCNPDSGLLPTEASPPHCLLRGTRTDSASPARRVCKQCNMLCEGRALSRSRIPFPTWGALLLSSPFRSEEVSQQRGEVEQRLVPRAWVLPDVPQGLYRGTNGSPGKWADQLSLRCKVCTLTRQAATEPRLGCQAVYSAPAPPPLPSEVRGTGSPSAGAPGDPQHCT